MSSGLVRSTNAGESWSDVIINPQDPNANAAILTPASNNTAVVSQGDVTGRLFRTTNGGKTFALAFPSQPQNPLQWTWIGFTTSQVGYGLSTQSPRYRVAINQLWRTTDGGKTWGRVP